MLVTEGLHDCLDVDGATDVDGERVLLPQVAELELAKEPGLTGRYPLTIERPGRVPLDLLEDRVDRAGWMPRRGA